MTWVYEQNNGKLYRPDGTLAATGYAGGDKGLHPEGVNNHEMQDFRNIGPLPCGVYTFLNPLMSSPLGPFAIPLLPGPDNEMAGRGHFYMHGDTAEMNRAASEGCIIMPPEIRHECWNSDDHTLVVKLSEI